MSSTSPPATCTRNPTTTPHNTSDADIRTGYTGNPTPAASSWTLTTATPCPHTPESHKFINPPDDTPRPNSQDQQATHHLTSPTLTDPYHPGYDDALRPPQNNDDSTDDDDDT
eukprot:2404069-Heterocapsa_arctica.AAC.1